MTEVTITDLYIYPLKSARGIRVNGFQTDRMGPVDDRRWMLVQPNGKFITQRQKPAMALIDVALTVDAIEFHAPGMKGVRVPKLLEDELSGVRVSGIAPSESRNSIRVQVWRDTCEALDCGDIAAQWFSEYLRMPCRLVQIPMSTHRYVDSDFCDHQETVGFADGFPLLLISQASLDDLNSRLSNAVSMLRFRPNVVVSGCEPFAEDSWRELLGSGSSGSSDSSDSSDSSILTVVKPCSRCSIPSIDFNTGEKDTEVLKALNTFRRREGIVYFGQNIVCELDKRYQVGQSLTIVE